MFKDLFKEFQTEVLKHPNLVRVKFSPLTYTDANGDDKSIDEWDGKNFDDLNQFDKNEYLFGTKVELVKVKVDGTIYEGPCCSNADLTVTFRKQGKTIKLVDLVGDTGNEYKTPKELAERIVHLAKKRLDKA